MKDIFTIKVYTATGELCEQWPNQYRNEVIRIISTMLADDEIAFSYRNKKIVIEKPNEQGRG